TGHQRLQASADAREQRRRVGRGRLGAARRLLLGRTARPGGVAVRTGGGARLAAGLRVGLLVARCGLGPLDPLATPAATALAGRTLGVASGCCGRCGCGCGRGCRRLLGSCHHRRGVLAFGTPRTTLAARFSTAATRATTTRATTTGTPPATAAPGVVRRALLACLAEDLADALALGRIGFHAFARLARQRRH